MRSNIVFILSIFLLFIPFNSGAQQKTATISFDETVHDFGEIKEENGNVSYKFEFTNTGSEPLIVQNVVPSCGCTTPSWTKKPVMPGEKGFVAAAFNPANRPGHFDKYVTVQSNASESSLRLRITGKVTPKPLSLEEEYRYAMGPVRLKTNHLSFGTVYKGQDISRNVEIINTSDEPVSLEFKNIPEHLNLNANKSTLKPNETADVNVTYLTGKQADWDFVIDRVDVYLNGQTDRTYKLVVSANMQEDFSGMTDAQKAKAANMEFTDKNFDFGKLKQGQSVQHEFKFTNTGKSDLVIHKVKASCGCTATMLSNEIIAPGEEGTIKVNFNSAGKSGAQNKTVTLITNDPNHPREILWIRGEVITDSASN